MKRIAIVWNDIFHYRETYMDMAARLFGKEDEVFCTEHIRDVILREPQPDLVVNFTMGCGKPDDHEPLSIAEQETLYAAVEKGMGCIYVHAGLAWNEADSPVGRLAGGRFASHPRPNVTVACLPIPGLHHPIMEGVAPFSARDEHYFCTVDLARVTPFLATVSSAGTEIGGWSQEIGKGRAVSLTPGHTPQMVEAMFPLMQNAVRWCLKEQMGKPVQG